MSAQAWASTILGACSILLWCAAEVPQVAENLLSPASPDEISFAFVVMWAVGDAFNLIGCIVNPVSLPTQLLLALLYTGTTSLLLVRRTVLLCCPGLACTSQPDLDGSLLTLEGDVIEQEGWKQQQRVLPRRKSITWSHDVDDAASLRPVAASPGIAPPVAIPTQPGFPRLSPGSMSGSWRAVTLATSYGPGSFAAGMFQGATPPLPTTAPLTHPAAPSTDRQEASPTRLRAVASGLILIGLLGAPWKTSSMSHPAASVASADISTPFRGPQSLGRKLAAVGQVTNQGSSGGSHSLLLLSSGVEVQGSEQKQAHPGSTSMPAPRPWVSTASGVEGDRGSEIVDSRRGASVGGKPSLPTAVVSYGATDSPGLPLKGYLVEGVPSHHSMLTKMRESGWILGVHASTLSATGFSEAPAPAPEGDIYSLRVEVAGILGWAMACIYLTGRLPQLVLNCARGAVDIASLPVFLCSLIGNACYFASILARGEEWELLWPNMPWLVDSGLCVAMDLTILFQHLYFVKVDEGEEYNYVAADV